MFTQGDSYNCPECDDRLKEERGCKKKGIMPCHCYLGTIYRCPITIITPLSWEYIKAYKFYEKNLLPNHVAWGEESNKYLQAMMLLNNEFIKWQNKERK